MRIADMTWMQVEQYLLEDDRCVLPLGSTEQHAYLSLAVDAILAAPVNARAHSPACASTSCCSGVRGGGAVISGAQSAHRIETLISLPGLRASLWRTRVPRGAPAEALLGNERLQYELASGGSHAIP